MEDQILQLAFAVYNNPGVYALLLGSGISRPAEIPTGWEIIQDLIRQIAFARHPDEEISGEPEDWYIDHFGEEPNYSDIVKRLGRKPSERNALLRRYFEPDDDDLEAGRKAPTDAHRAIAWLIKQGYIKVVLTTNFDRLLETALAEIGVTPDVVSTEAQLKGMRPLQHSEATIIKLHGDYRDDAFRNTVEELSKYSRLKNKLLDRILDEYGLIVCGWSAAWDSALQGAISRQKSRRYTVYWSWYGSLTDDAQQLIKHRDALELPNLDANALFGELKEMVEALALSKRTNPSALPVLIERAKRFIQYGVDIDLEELIRSERERSYERFVAKDFIERLSKLKSFEELWQLYIDATEPVLNIAATVAWYGNGDHSKHLEAGITRWMQEPDVNWIRQSSIYSSTFDDYGHFPTVLLMYSIGIAATYNRKWDYLADTLVKPKTNTIDRNGLGLAIYEIGERTLNLLRTRRSFNSNGQFLNDLLRPIFQTYIPSAQDYAHTFDLFEMLMALAYLHQFPERDWMPTHLAYRTNRSWPFLQEFWRSGGSQGSGWNLLSSDLIITEKVAQKDQVFALLKRYVDFANRMAKNHNIMFPDIPKYHEVYYKG